MTELPDIDALRDLDPPPGGLEQLRARLDRERTRWWLAAIPAVALAAVVLWLAIDRDRPIVASEPKMLPDPTIASDDRVTFYWVASTPAGEPPHPAAITSGPPPTITP